MYNSAGLIPSRFLILLAHFTICVNLLWNNQVSGKFCLTQGTMEESVANSLHIQVVTGLSISLGLICIEFLAFVCGLTMFNSSSALLSVTCHGFACGLLYFVIFDSWHCNWYWWIFVFGALLPAIYDFFVVLNVFIKDQYF